METLVDYSETETPVEFPREVVELAEKLVDQCFGDYAEAYNAALAYGTKYGTMWTQCADETERVKYSKRSHLFFYVAEYLETDGM
jgi:hypothetical protein